MKQSKLIETRINHMRNTVKSTIDANIHNLQQLRQKLLYLLDQIENDELRK